MKNCLQRFWISGHGSLSSNLIGQNGYFGGMRHLRDSGSQFLQTVIFMDRPVRFDEVIAIWLPFVPKISNQSLHH